MNFKSIAVIFLFFTANTFALADNGMIFPEFSQKIGKYFDEKLISDVEKELPTTKNFKVWGWDVGDFSGDGYNDLAFAIRNNKDKGRNITVYLFVDIEGYLIPVKVMKYNFFEIPLEIGIVIKNKICYVTQKHKEFNWTIKGFTFENGNLILVDEFNTKKDKNKTKESYNNFLTLRNSEKLIKTNSGEVELNIEYISIPSYPRGKYIYNGYNNIAYSSNIDYVKSGAFDWEGAEDASFQVKSSYNDSYIYFSIEVIDDIVVGKDCDECYSDYVDLWIDTTPLDFEDKFKLMKRKININEKYLSNLYKFSIDPGDFLERKPSIQIHTIDANQNDDLQNYLDELKVVSDFIDGGYLLKFKIPFKLLGISTESFVDIIELPCTIVINDIDNKYRPEVSTEIASSKFTSNDPSSYGTLLIIPPDKWYGESRNIFIDDISKFLENYGY